MKHAADIDSSASARRSTVIGVLWMVGCLVSFIGMALGSRELAANMPILQVLLLRSLVGLVVMLLLAHHLLPELRQLRDVRLHGVRNLIHFGAQYCWTVGIALLPLAHVFALEFTMPIWVALFAWLALGERISRVRLLAIAAGFIGVLVVLQPGSGGFNPAAMFVLMSAAGFGVSAVLVKRLTAGSSSAVIVMWMVVIQLPLALAILALTGGWVMPAWTDVHWILVVGLTGLSAHYTMAQALRVMDASLAIPIDFLRLPLVALLGWLLYGEAVGAAVFIGAAIIFGANYMAVRAEMNAGKAPARR